MSSCSFTQCYSGLIFLGRAHRSLPGETLLVTWCCRSAHSVSQSPKNGLQRLSNCKQCRNTAAIALKYRCGACSIIKTQQKHNHILKTHWLEKLPFPCRAWSPMLRLVVCCSFVWCCDILPEQVSLCQAWSPHSLCSPKGIPELLLVQPLPCHSTPKPLGRTSQSPGRPCTLGILPGLSNSQMTPPLSQPPAATRALSWLPSSKQGVVLIARGQGPFWGPWGPHAGLVTYTGHRWSQNAFSFTGKGQTTPCRHPSLLCGCIRDWGTLFSCD